MKENELTVVEVPKFAPPAEQMAQLGRHKWNVSRLIEITADFPVMEIPMTHLNIYYKYDGLTLRGMAMHMAAVNDADMSFPIILDEDGELMDGRHRVMKALVYGMKTIKAVRFVSNPPPCVVED